MTRVSKSTHMMHPWRIHELLPDFTLKDVWRVRTPGAGPGDFESVMRVIRQLGGRPKTLDGDRPGSGPDGKADSVRERVNPEWRAVVPVTETGLLSSIYQLPTEAASEMVNEKVHRVMHWGWMRAADGSYELHVAVYLKPRAAFGRLYTAIAPFRDLFVWPALIRAWERGWTERELVRGGIVSRHPIPQRLSITPSYLDRFTLATEVIATPRAWAEAMFEQGIPRSNRNLIFQTILGLDIHPDDDPGSVAGWDVQAEDSEHILLSARSSGSTGQLLIEVRPAGVSLTTAFAFASRLRAAVWKQLSRVHRRVAAPTMRNGALLIRCQLTAAPSPELNRDPSIELGQVG